MNVRRKALENNVPDEHVHLSDNTDVMAITKGVPLEVHHDKTQVVYVEQGIGYVTIENVKYNMSAGSLIVIPRGKRHVIENLDVPNVPLKIVTVYI